ncbi:MAG TPA: aminomethyl-transferring glycine dehydrogenase subunit GcvPA [Solirubrobacteraceae bacterium]|nr:aminomethyl-transferring glycine dehydrogenase subunit GcvPA [Solirubrobacteraceae bacterium]
MSRYTSATDADRAAMLERIGAGSIDELFADIPDSVRLDRAIDLPPGKPEQEVYAYLRDLAARNVSAEDELCFLGAGMYDHYVPSLVDALLSRSEFLTPYTPYQPEVSQGTLQVMFEYQTAISELTGLPVSNATLYEAPSAVASAGWMARLQNGRERFLVSRALHPHSREALATTAAGYGTAVEELPLAAGVTDADALREAIGDDVSAVFLQQPNFLGAIEDLEALAPIARETGALLVVQVDPMTLGVLRPPGDFEVDIAVGEGQSLGNRLDYGGPSFGFFAAQEAYIRRMPGRIAGETVDADGKRGFVLTLQTREQHIRREKATHNITTAQTLNALAGVAYLAWLGRRGIVEIGELLLHRTAYARRALAGLEGVELLHEQPVVREFAVRVDAAVDRVIERCAEQGVNPGYPLSADYEEFGDGLLVAITEQRSKADIDRLAEVLGAAVAAEREAVTA